LVDVDEDEESDEDNREARKKKLFEKIECFTSRSKAFVISMRQPYTLPPFLMK
jgi:hypothetical protein